MNQLAEDREMATEIIAILNSVSELDSYDIKRIQNRFFKIACRDERKALIRRVKENEPHSKTFCLSVGEPLTFDDRHRMSTIDSFRSAFVCNH